MRNLFFAARPILIDMASSLLFAALFGLTSNIYLATGCAIALGFGQVGLEKLRRRPIPGMQWASLGLVTVLGAATLFTGDPRFVMIKPTIIYLTVGAAMLQPGWLDRYMPPAAKDYLPRRLVVGAGYVWAGLMFLTAALNLIIATRFDHRAWLAFIGVFPLASKLGLFAIHYLTFRFIALRNYRASVLAAQPA